MTAPAPSRQGPGSGFAAMEAVRGIGVDYAQGYAIARPRPFDASFFEIEPAESRRRQVA